MTSVAEKLQGDGFVIENNIIKGDKKCYNFKEDNIGEVIFNALSKKPECIAEIDALTGKSKTFADIKQQSIVLATWMRKEGIGPGDVVSVCTPRHPDVIVIFYATTFIGATFFPIPGDVNLISSRRLINLLPPRLVFADKNKIGVLEEAATLENQKWKMVVFDNDGNTESLNNIFKTQLSDEIEHFQVSKVIPENICLLINTSGTTGTPKLIPVDYELILRVFLTFDVNKGSNNSKTISLSYLYPEWRVHYSLSVKCLISGWTQIYHKNFCAHETFKIIEKYKVNFLFLDPHELVLLNQADAAKNYDLTSVTSIVSVGSKTFDEVRRKTLDIFPNLPFVSILYGMTEASVVTAFTNKCCNPESEGTVAPNVQVKIIDKMGQALGHKKIGELCIKTSCMIKGYYKNPEANIVFDDEGWFHSGDEGYYDENGEIVIIGRSKEMIRYRAHDIYPMYVEENLLAHPSIVDSAVVGIEHDLYNEQPVAYVKVSQGANVTEEEVLKLMPKLEYKDIFKNWIIFTDDIPRTVNGKILRRVLKERAEKFYKTQSH